MFTQCDGQRTNGYELRQNGHASPNRNLSGSSGTVLTIGLETQQELKAFARRKMAVLPILSSIIGTFQFYNPT